MRLVKSPVDNQDVEKSYIGDTKTLRFIKSIILMNYLGVSSCLCDLVAKKDFSEQAQYLIFT